MVYSYLYVIERLSPFTYRKVPKQLPNWIKVEITSNDDSKIITIHSRIHVNKSKQYSICYSLDWSDQDILKDISGQIYHDYGI